jgi:hypothetical protein
MSQEHGTYSTTESFVIDDGRPIIESFSPASGPPGTWIGIQGKNLKYATSVLFNGLKAERWGLGIDPVNIGLLALVPINATTGPITVAGLFGDAASEADFVVTASSPFTVKEWPVETEAGMVLMLNPTVFEPVAGGLALEVPSRRLTTAVRRPMTDPPPLSVAFTTGKALKLTWPAGRSGCILEMNEDLAPDHWRQATTTPTVKNGAGEFVFTMDRPQCFFRLTASRTEE